MSDLARSRAFYERALGLIATASGEHTVLLSAGDGAPLLELHGDPAAPPRDPRATGLYHLAIRLPSRRDLAVALAHLKAFGWPLDGASDHLVSEALYLSDPDGNGIEIYRDRDRSEWRYRNGELQMATLPLDLALLLGELHQGGPPPARAAGRATIGHVHLQVADLRSAEAFYVGVLGFEVTVRAYPGALFVSAGGYHHHLGLNIWQSAGAAPPAPGSVGLRDFEIVVPALDELKAVLRRLRAAGIDSLRTDGGALVRDPSGNALVLRGD